MPLAPSKLARDGRVLNKGDRLLLSLGRWAGKPPSLSICTRVPRALLSATPIAHPLLPYMAANRAVAPATPSSPLATPRRGVRNADDEVLPHDCQTAQQQEMMRGLAPLHRRLS